MEIKLNLTDEEHKGLVHAAEREGWSVDELLMRKIRAVIAEHTKPRGLGHVLELASTEVDGWTGRARALHRQSNI